MRVVLQNKLIKDFPDLYRQVHLPYTQTCMCWGFECGDGWFGIIYELSKNLMKLDPTIEALQVKEKFGGLRFYYGGGANIDEVLKIEALVNKAEQESYKTCEWCGSKNKISQTEGWVVTLCDKCLKLREKGKRRNRNDNLDVEELKKVPPRFKKYFKEAKLET